MMGMGEYLYEYPYCRIMLIVLVQYRTTVRYKELMQIAKSLRIQYSTVRLLESWPRARDDDEGSAPRIRGGVFARSLPPWWSGGAQVEHSKNKHCEILRKSNRMYTARTMERQTFQLHACTRGTKPLRTQVTRAQLVQPAFVGTLHNSQYLAISGASRLGENP